MGSTMDAIKKKMQAMKVEKDNACDRADQCEEASKAAKLRASKAEDEVSELAAKARQLETVLDLCSERLGIVTLQLEEKEKALRRTLRKPRRNSNRPTPSLTRLELLLTIPKEPRRSLRTKQLMTTRESLNWRRNSRMLETRPRLLMLLMRRLPRSSPPVSLISRRLRREQIPERQRSLNSKKN